MRKNRISARGLTIDAAETTVLDDAIWLVQDSKGNSWLEVSIADVASLVTKGTILDTAARKNGSNAIASDHFLFGGDIEKRFSLADRQTRRAITVTIPISTNGRIGTIAIKRTWLTNLEKMSYSKVNKILESGVGPFSNILLPLRQVAYKLNRSRRRLHALDAKNNERWITNPEGKSVLVLDQYGDAGMIVKESMLLTNFLLTDMAVQHGVPLLFKNHESDQTFYAPIAYGHTKLRVKAYARFTSPLRDYADKVNQEILVAIISGHSSPYFVQELGIIAQELNTMQSKIKQAEAAFKASSASRG